MSLTAVALQFVGWSNDRLLLLIVLPIAVRLGRATWHRAHQPEALLLTRLAAYLWLCLVPWATFTVVGHAAGVNPNVWAPVLDRLIGVAAVVAVGWVAVPRATERRWPWRRLLALSLGVSTIAYAAWALLWADAFTADPRLAVASGVAALRFPWDAWQLGLAVVAAILCVKGARAVRAPGRTTDGAGPVPSEAHLTRIARWSSMGAPRWAWAVAASLVAGHLLQVVAAPEQALLAVWSRLGILAAGLAILAAGVARAVEPAAAEAPGTGTAPGATAGAGDAGDAAEPVMPLNGWPGAVWAPLIALINDQTIAIQRLNRVLERLAECIAPAADSQPSALAPDPSPEVRTPVAVVEPAAAAPAAPAAIVRAPAGDTDAGPAIGRAAATPPGMGPLADVLLPDLTEALKAPMTSILGYSDLLARGSGLREEQVNRYLQRIDANLMRMRVMLDNLLTVLAQPEHPDRSARGVDVSRVIRDAVDRTLPQFNEKGLAVHVAIDDLLPPMFAHPDSVTRIIDNLLVNATQRSPQGGDVRVSAALKSAPGDEDTVMISVTDHGRRLPALPGADAADAADVDASTRVALRIVKFLAEHHGGSAWAESLPAGTGFHVTLPFRRTA